MRSSTGCGSGGDLEVVSPDLDAALRLAEEVAPDITPALAIRMVQVDAEDFRKLSPVPPDTGVIAIARRPEVSAADVLDGPADLPVVLLENPPQPFQHRRSGAGCGSGRRGGDAGHRIAGSLASRCHRRGGRTAVRLAGGPSVGYSRRRPTGHCHRPAGRSDALGAGSPRRNTGLRDGEARREPGATGSRRTQALHTHDPRGFQPEPGDVGCCHPLCAEILIGRMV